MQSAIDVDRNSGDLVFELAPSWHRLVRSALSQVPFHSIRPLYLSIALSLLFSLLSFLSLSLFSYFLFSTFPLTAGMDRAYKFTPARIAGKSRFTPAFFYFACNSIFRDCRQSYGRWRRGGWGEKKKKKKGKKLRASVLTTFERNLDFQLLIESHVSVEIPRPCTHPLNLLTTPGVLSRRDRKWKFHRPDVRAGKR